MSTTLMAILGCLLGVDGFVYAFVGAFRTKRLSKLAIALGAASFLSGIGTIPFFALGWKAVQQEAFHRVAEGGDPLVARKLMRRYSVAVATSIVCAVVLFFKGTLR